MKMFATVCSSIVFRLYYRRNRCNFSSALDMTVSHTDTQCMSVRITHYKGHTLTHTKFVNFTANWPLSAAVNGPWRRLYFICSFLLPSPLSTDSCFLTNPTLFQANPVIMRLCPELRATREQCQQLGADLLNGLAFPRSRTEQKLHLIVWVESCSLPQGIAHVQIEHWAHSTPTGHTVCVYSWRQAYHVDNTM